MARLSPRYVFPGSIFRLIFMRRGSSVGSWGLISGKRVNAASSGAASWRKGSGGRPTAQRRIEFGASAGDNSCRRRNFLGAMIKRRIDRFRGLRFVVSRFRCLGREFLGSARRFTWPINALWFDAAQFVPAGRHSTPVASFPRGLVHRGRLARSRLSSFNLIQPNKYSITLRSKKRADALESVRDRAGMLAGRLPSVLLVIASLLKVIVKV